MSGIKIKESTELALQESQQKVTWTISLIDSVMEILEYDRHVSNEEILKCLIDLASLIEGDGS